MANNNRKPNQQALYVRQSPIPSTHSSSASTSIASSASDSSSASTRPTQISSGYDSYGYAPTKHGFKRGIGGKKIPYGLLNERCFLGLTVGRFNDGIGVQVKYERSGSQQSWLMMVTAEHGILNTLHTLMSQHVGRHFLVRLAVKEGGTHPKAKSAFLAGDVFVQPNSRVYTINLISSSSLYAGISSLPGTESTVASWPVSRMDINIDVRTGVFRRVLFVEDQNKSRHAHIVSLL